MRRSGLLIVALLVVGCTGGDGDDEDAASTTTAAPTTTVVETTTTTTAPPDPFAVPADPADIDEAYVEAVLTELERINGDALRLAVSEGLSPAVAELLQSIFDPGLSALRVEVLLDDSSAGFPGILRPPGDVVARVTAINVARLDCISVDVELDFSQVAEGGVAASPTRVELRPRRSEDAASNPTPWIFLVRDPISSSTGLPEECATD